MAPQLSDWMSIEPRPVGLTGYAFLWLNNMAFADIAEALGHAQTAQVHRAKVGVYAPHGNCAPRPRSRCF